MKRNRKGQFIKGSNGFTFEGFGVWYDAKGYPNIWINNKNIKIHIFVWERKNGEKPKGFDIHHEDFNKANFEISNLKLLSYSDHKKTHAGWVKDKKGEWTLKPCKTCGEKLSLDSFYQRKGLTPSNHCIPCSSKNHKKKLIESSDYREKKRLYLKEYYKNNKELILHKQQESWKKKKAGVCSAN